MSTTAPSFKYRRLPGRGLRKTGAVTVTAIWNTMWLAPDHLLSLDRIWMAEEFKRFYFRDIQAITIQRTKRGRVWNWILGSLLLLTVALFGWLTYQEPSRGSVSPFIITGSIIGGLWFFFLVVNLVRGPTCSCRVRTAVQEELVPAWGRERKARKALAIVRPLIAQAQGEPSPTAAGPYAAAASGASSPLAPPLVPPSTVRRDPDDY